MIFHKFSKTFSTSSWWLYNKAFIKEFFSRNGKYSDAYFLHAAYFIQVLTPKLQFEYFAIWATQLDNKSIMLR